MDKRGFSRVIRSIDSGVSRNKETLDIEARQLSEMSEIMLRLGEYEDIFSDFDPRPHAKRALSDDFLIELQKASAEKIGDQIELRFLLQQGKKDAVEENTIRKRLHDHFGRHYQLVKGEIKRTRINGAVIAFFGSLLLGVSTYLAVLPSEKVFNKVIWILLEPAGWFTAWYGLDQIFYWARENKQQLDFYEKMHKSKIVFAYY